MTTYSPPLTTNTLDAEQRSRLLRSTRKLGAMLGATPLVLEVTPSPVSPRTKTFRREGRVFPSSRSSTESYIIVSSTIPMAPYQPILPTPSKQPKVTPKQKGARPLAQPLILRLRSVPAKKARYSPITTSFDFTASSSPTQNDRRRKMAKLTRTLGENVPPELVFAPKRSLSARRPTMRKGVSAPIHADEPFVLSPVPESKKRGGGRPRSLTLGSIPTPTPQYAMRGTTSLDSPRLQATSDQMEADWGRRENGVRRKEREWSGEWNMQDMGDVVKALRELR
ncbi:hypothetical protein K443DRAFT_109495 [Laccaria amethystina LaAM-08-1]|uniref:Uncharacterized protein n=1 Tax=Laccaria amethystina LaAM-08-1 TaxID=1095629 RepID=A0A0C9XBD7_9AGAR|nr:hypothetical protein K443DRAFT_109495 [Laccaria amethystina LaAM-08-1]